MNYLTRVLIEDSTCYYPEYSGNYEGNLNTSVTDLPCVSWTDNRVSADFAPNSTAWTKGKLGTLFFFVLPPHILSTMHN